MEHLGPEYRTRCDKCQKCQEIRIERGAEVGTLTPKGFVQDFVRPFPMPSFIDHWNQEARLAAEFQQVDQADKHCCCHYQQRPLVPSEKVLVVTYAHSRPDPLPRRCGTDPVPFLLLSKSPEGRADQYDRHQTKDYQSQPGTKATCKSIGH